MEPELSFLSTNMYMDALVLDPQKRAAVCEKVPKPLPGPFEICLRVEAVSLNPVDALYVRHPLANSKRTVGSDFAGTVISMGTEVPLTSNLKIGDHVSGFLQGACSVNERPGAFSEYIAVPWDLVWKLPKIVSLEQAAGVSLCALTAAQVVWYRLGLEAPFNYDEGMALSEHPEWAFGRKIDPAGSINAFVYGASTSVGLFAAQMFRISAKASGQKIRLYGTASKAKWEMLRSEPYCYEHLVDYHEDNWLERVTDIVGQNKIQYAVDCIAEGSSVEKVSSLLVQDGKIATLRSREGGAWNSSHLTKEPIYGAVWEGLGEEVHYQGFVVPHSPAARQFAVRFYNWLTKAIGSVIQPVPVRLMPGGLDKVIEQGFELIGSGKMEDRAVLRTEEWMRPISAEKLVYKPWSSA